MRVVDERAQEIYRTLVKEGRAMLFDPLPEGAAKSAMEAEADAAKAAAEAPAAEEPAAAEAAAE